MALLDLLLDVRVELEIEVAVGVCNFELRGAESDGDFEFVRGYAAEMGVECYGVSFDTRGAMKRSGESVQMTARRLRYDWFEMVAVREGYNRVAVAHHGGDQVETFFINLVRGSGLRGLRGMEPCVGLGVECEGGVRLVRPLLSVSRGQVDEYVARRGVAYRDDSSNDSDHYLRNALRHGVVPELCDLTRAMTGGGDFARTMLGNMERLAGVERFVVAQIEEIRGEVMSVAVVGGGVHADVVDFEALGDICRRQGGVDVEFVLYELLRSYGFSGAVVRQMVSVFSGVGEGCNQVTGKLFASDTHGALLDRGKILVCRKLDVEAMYAGDDVQIIERDDSRVEFVDCGVGGCSAVEVIRLAREVAAVGEVAYFDAERLRFPLTLRRFRVGDVIAPIGMGGRRKKVSDLLVDRKVSRFEKQGQMVVLSSSDNEDCTDGVHGCSHDVVWVVGRCVSHFAMVTAGTEHVVRLTVVGNVN